jgi:hypothetical protein
MILAERNRTARLEVESRLVEARPDAAKRERSCAPALWHRSECAARKLEQFQLEELKATVAKDDLAAERAAARSRTFGRRRRLSREPFADHLPRERLVSPPPIRQAVGVREE